MEDYLARFAEQTPVAVDVQGTISCQHILSLVLQRINVIIFPCQKCFHYKYYWEDNKLRITANIFESVLHLLTHCDSLCNKTSVSIARVGHSLRVVEYFEL